MTLMMIGDHIEITGPLKEEGTKVTMEDHQIEDTITIEDILGEIIQVKMGDPLIMEDHLMVEDPLIMEDPLLMGDPLVMEDSLIMEDPWEMDDILDTLEDKDHQDPKDLLDL